MLPSFRKERCSARVDANPLDGEAWAVLIQEVMQQCVPEDFRPVFESCTQFFPNAAMVWRQWVEAEIRANCFDQVEGIFERCLLRCPHLELWRLYLQYLKDAKRVPAKELQAAYELLLEAVGPDVRSAPLWLEYVALLKSAVEPNMMPGSAAVTAARDAFQRAILQPVANLEPLWKEYEAWENAQSGPQAKLVLGEISDRALVARRVARERRELIEPLILNQMPHVPKRSDDAQLRGWRKLWEYAAAAHPHG